MHVQYLAGVQSHSVIYLPICATYLLQEITNECGESQNTALACDTVCLYARERADGWWWVGEKSREHISLNLLFFLVSAPHHHHATPADIRYQFSSFARR